MCTSSDEEIEDGEVDRVNIDKKLAKQDFVRGKTLQAIQSISKNYNNENGVLNKGLDEGHKITTNLNDVPKRSHWDLPIESSKLKRTKTTIKEVRKDHHWDLPVPMK